MGTECLQTRATPWQEMAALPRRAPFLPTHRKKIKPACLYTHRKKSNLPTHRKNQTNWRERISVPHRKKSNLPTHRKKSNLPTHRKKSNQLKRKDICTTQKEVKPSYTVTERSQISQGERISVPHWWGNQCRNSSRMPYTYYCKSRIFRTHSIFVSWALRAFVCMKFSYSRWPLRILWLALYLSHAFYFRTEAAAYEIYENKMHTKYSGFTVFYLYSNPAHQKDFEKRKDRDKRRATSTPTSSTRTSFLILPVVRETRKQRRSLKTKDTTW